MDAFTSIKSTWKNFASVDVLRKYHVHQECFSVLSEDANVSTHVVHKILHLMDVQRNRNGVLRHANVNVKKNHRDLDAELLSTGNMKFCLKIVRAASKLCLFLNISGIIQHVAAFAIIKKHVILHSNGPVSTKNI